MVLVVVAAAGSLTWALLQGWISTYQIQSLVGRAPGQIVVTDFAARPVNARLDPSLDLTLQPDQTSQLSAISQGRYTLVFTFTTGAEVARCTLQIGNADLYRFVVTDKVAIVFRKGQTPTHASDINVATSPLCNG